jgi:hypothetical protein
MISLENETYSYFTGEYANANAWLSELQDQPSIQYLHIFYEDVRMKEREITFTINLN